MPDLHNGMLVLEDGNVFVGASMGADGEFVGEVVFNTSMSGYQEIITDPSYWGQMVVFTCPHIGNVGVNDQDVESRQPWVRAIIARRICGAPSNWRSQRALPEYLRQAGIPALSGVDTRRLTLLLREKGVMRGAISTASLDVERLLQMARSAPDMSTLAALAPVSPASPELWAAPVPKGWYPRVPSPGEERPTAPPRTGSASLVVRPSGRSVRGEDPPNGGTTNEDVPVRSTWPAEPAIVRAGTRPGAPHIVVIDCGCKHNIVRHLISLGAHVTLVPWDATAEQILAQDPDGVLISNGPGDPERASQTIQTTRHLIDSHVPILGICLGHQLIGLACGGRTYKLPFGHHAGNHPVQNLLTGAVEITAQNHNYAIDPQSLEGSGLQITHINLNDHTVEGLRHTRLPVASVQYHPEASPGPHDSLRILRDFVESLAQRRTPEEGGADA